MSTSGLDNISNRTEEEARAEVAAQRKVRDQAMADCLARIGAGKTAKVIDFPLTAEDVEFAESRL